MKSFLVYKFTCASCSSSYIGETCRHFKTRIEEHIKKDNKSHIFKHLHSTATCFDSYNSLCFKIIDKAKSKFDLKTKEALHINRRELKCTTRSFSSHHFTIVMGIFFCLNYTLLLICRHWFGHEVLLQLYTGCFYSVDGWWKVQPKYQYFTKPKIVFSNLIICISF